MLLALLAGCTATDDPAPAGEPTGRTASATAGTSINTITADGRQRTFRLYRPASLTGPAPLVMMLHGGFGTGSQAESAYGWNGLADREGFLVAYPDGLNRAWNVGGGCCGRPATDGVDDVAFVQAMIAAIERLAPVDPLRRYATGISNGGMLAYRLACDTTLFAAVGPVAATLLGPCPPPAPLSVIHVHGLDDRSVRYDGGRGDGVARIDGPPVPEVIARWRATNRCGPPSVTTAGAVTTSAADCAGGRSVELITIARAGHQWPGAEARRVLQQDPPSSALDATEAIWRFFATHPGT
jgi:polyhydroxybutyrate depolymerase